MNKQTFGLKTSFSCLRVVQGGRCDLPQHHGEERHPAGRQGAASVRQVSQTAAGGGGGDGTFADAPSVRESLLSADSPTAGEGRRQLLFL